jgi:hypothetical protein
VLLLESGLEFELVMEFVFKYGLQVGVGGQVEVFK